MTANVLNDTSTQIPILQQSIQLTATDFDDRELAADEETVQSHQCSDCCTFAEQDTGRIPVFG
jgi:hypothetical protein